MIGGAVHGGGGPALGSHLAAPQPEDEARPGSSRGLMCQGIKDQVRELTDLARASGQKEAIRHAFASPAPGQPWGPKEQGQYWQAYERMMGLEGCAYSEALHAKAGDHDRPDHVHRTYLALTSRGTLVRAGHDYARQEAVSRLTEYDMGMPMTKGAHNVRAARYLTEAGREDVAAAMAVAGLLDGSRARADLSPRDRLIQERTKVEKADVARGTAAAWAASERGTSLADALDAQGLRLAWGDKKAVPVVVDKAGTAHGLAQMLRMAAREDGTEAPRPEAIAVRLDGMAVPPVADVRREIRAEGAEPAAPIPHDHEAAPIPRAAAPDPAGQPVPVPEAQAPAPVAAAPAPAPASTAASGQPGGGGTPSRDAGPSAAPSVPKAGGGGGGGAVGGDAGGGGSAVLADVGDGPGPSPGPGASPEERSRWLAQLAAFEDRKAAAWRRWIAAGNAGAGKATPTPSGAGGLGIGNVQQAGEALAAVIAALRESYHCARSAEAIREAIKRFEADAARVRAGIAPAITGHGDDRAAGGGGPEAGRDDIRDARTGRPNGGLPGRHGESEGGGGADSDRGNPGRPDGCGGEPAPDRGEGRQAFRRAAAQVRLARGLAAQPDAMARLRKARLELDPAWRSRRDAYRRLQADRAGIAAVLGTHPHPDPADRDPTAREKREERTAKDEHKAERAIDATATAEAARAAYRDRGPLTWLRNVMLDSPTPGQRRLLDAADYAARNKDSCPDDGTLRAARERGRLLAIAARDRTAEWEDRPEVRGATEKARLNEAVDQAAADGDPAIRAALRAGDPDGARAVIQAREAEERRRMEDFERRQGIQRGPNGPAGPRAGGPRLPGIK